MPAEPVRRSAAARERAPHADIDHVRAVIRTRPSGYAIVSPRRRPPARRPRP